MKIAGISIAVVATAMALPLPAETETVDGYEWTYRVVGDTVEIDNDRYVAISPLPTGAVVIPPALGGKPVTAIGMWALNYCSEMTSVTIPPCVTRIDYGAFSDCEALTSVVIPDSVTELGEFVFYKCTNLKTATIGTGLKTLPMNTFSYCKMTNIDIPASLTSIGKYVFGGCIGPRSLTIPGNVKELVYGTFSGCTGIEKVTLKEGVEQMGWGTFKGCTSLSSVVIPSTVTNLGLYVFRDCPLKTIYLSDKEGEEERVRKLLRKSDLDVTDISFVVGDPAYTVRYYKYDGSGATADEEFECGKTYTAAWLGSDLGWARSGYDFIGWVPWKPDTKPCLCKYVNGQPVKDLAPAGGRVDLYAGWKSSSSYRVCFNRNAGPDDTAKMNQVIMRNKETALALLGSQIGWERPGYVFRGWGESAEATAVKYANGAKVTNLAQNGGTKQLYALWRSESTAPYTVRYYKYDGSGETKDQAFKVGTVQSLLWLGSGLGWSRPGYEFIGWVPWKPDTKPCLCKYANGQKVVDLTTTSGGVVSLYPGWKSSSSYRVCFNRNDGTGVSMNQVVMRNKEDTLALIGSQIGWEREGYVFRGWAETEKGAVKYANGAKVKNLAMDGGTKHLYAIWRVAD